MPARRSSGDVVAGEEVANRVFAAPRDLVFEVWTKAEHFARWFGPLGAEMVACELDPRPGGVLRFGHRFPDGTTFHFKGTFRKVLPNELVAFAIGSVDEFGRPARHPMFPDWPLDLSIETTVTFEDVGDGTRVTVMQRVTPPEVSSHPAVKRWEHLAREGWMQVIDRLRDHLSLATARAEHPR
jgi:uncharacterized protein YndB with AHSA1/START domain